MVQKLRGIFNKMVLPLIVWGAAAGVTALSGATYFGLKNQEPDKVYNTTYQDTYQNDYITNSTEFDFSNSYFEDGSNIDLSNYANVETSKEASQTASQVGKDETKAKGFNLRPED